MNKVITQPVTQSQQKRMFVNHLVSYITHSKHIYLHSAEPGHRSKVLKCDDLLYEVKKLHSVASFIEVKRTVLRLRQKLFEILPHEKNNSYRSSLDDYNNIVEFCTQYKIPEFIFT